MQKHMKEKAPLLWLLGKVRRRIPALLLMTGANVAVAFLGVMFALGTKNVINSAVSGDRGALLRAIVVQLGIILTLLACSALCRYVSAKLSAELDRDWKRMLSHRIFHSEYASISSFHTAELLNRMNSDVHQVNDGLLSILPGLSAMVTKLVAAVAVLLAMAPRLTVLLGLVGIAAVLVTGVVRRFLKNMNKAISASNGKVSGFYQEAFEKLLLVQAMNVEQEVERRGEQVMAERFRLQKKRMAVSVTANSCVGAMGLLCGFLALSWCAFGLAAGTMSFGELTAVMQLVSQLQTPFVNLSGVLPKYIATVASCERLMELEEACCTTEEPGSCAPYEAVEAVCARNLHFSYDRDKVLDDCGFTIPKGSFTVLTGPSGAGKSTVLKLLLRIFRPEAGELYWQCGGEQKPLTLADRALFAYVPQGNLLFSGTLRENLLLTQPQAGEAELQRAVRLSCLDAVVEAMPEGLETRLGENAHGLSEGQAQRLSIARAILSDAPVILLDEATSALDAETEAQVLRNLRSIPGKTCIAVTHRPAALELADLQLQVADGTITEIHQK